MMKYFKVVVKCGHVGRKKYVPIAFAIKARNGKEASEKARLIPRVKHTQKYAVLGCVKISREEFYNLIKINNQDDYLKCHSNQDLNRVDMSNRLVDDPHYYEVLNKIRHIPTYNDVEKRKSRIEYRRKKEKCFLASLQIGGAF